jgi:nucleoside-diphosphate-sugar epimerase
LKTKESSTFSWTAIWSALLFDWGLSNGFLEFDVANKTATIWDDGNSRFTLTNADQLGDAVVATLERPAQTANKNLYVASAEVSQNEILAAFEVETGSKWTVKHTTTKEEVSAAQEKLARGDLSGAFALVRATSFATIPDLRANYLKDEEFSNDLLGLKFEPVATTIARVVADSRA